MEYKLKLKLITVKINVLAFFYPSPPPNTNASSCQNADNLDLRCFRNRKANTFGIKQIMEKTWKKLLYFVWSMY